MVETEAAVQAVDPDDSQKPDDIGSLSLNESHNENRPAVSGFSGTSRSSASALPLPQSRMNAFRPGRMTPINLRTQSSDRNYSTRSPQLSPVKVAGAFPTVSTHHNEKRILQGENTDNNGKDSKLEHTSNHAMVTRTPSASERILELRGPGKRNWHPVDASKYASTSQSNQTDTSLFVRRLQRTKEKQSVKAQEESQLGLRELQQTFAVRQSSVDNVNWEFWAMLIGDYDEMARTQPQKLKQAIQDGFPSELRGLLWQVISSSKSSALEQLYQSLLTVEECPCSTAINKDLSRTPMAKSVDQGSLARLLRAYSLFDPEVGYTQGMAFIAAPILRELNEAEAFSLFVQLMKTYDFRSVFMAEMPGLHLKLYQFDRLVEDNLETLHTHMRRQGIQSSMYASQWFLTMFAYRFPPSLVTRIFDIVIAEGVEALLRFAFALMESATPDILEHNGLDVLLPYLKEKIFDRFDGCENELVKLASNVELLPHTLSKFELEHQELNRLEKERMEQMDTLRTSNSRLSLQNKQLEASLESLNAEHIQIANEMVKYGMELDVLRDENHDLKERLATLNSEHEMFGEVANRLNHLTRELAFVKHDNESMQQELALLRKVQGIQDTAALVKELDQLKEVNNRYELQLGSLQESLASALEGH